MDELKKIIIQELRKTAVLADLYFLEANYISEWSTSREELRYKTGVCDRQVRRAIHELRRDGYKIISSSDRPGYWLGTSAEWNDFCDKQRSKGIAGMFKKTTEYDKQLRIVAEDKDGERAKMKGEGK